MIATSDGGAAMTLTFRVIAGALLWMSAVSPVLAPASARRRFARSRSFR